MSWQHGESKYHHHSGGPKYSKRGTKRNSEFSGESKESSNAKRNKSGPGKSSSARSRSMTRTKSPGPTRMTARNWKGTKTNPPKYRKMLKGKRRVSGQKKQGKSFWAAGPGHRLKGSVPMIAKNQGTKVERVYGAFGGTISSTAAVTSQLAYSFRIMNNAGNIDLEMWSGSPGGGGALVVTFNDFRAECAHFIDVFKWLKIIAVEMQFYPIVNTVNESATSALDTVTQNDPGRFYVAPWNGDPDSVSAAGIPQVDLTEFMRYKPLTMDPVGEKGVTYTREPNCFFVQAGDVFPVAGVPNRLNFPVAPPWETSQFRVASAAMPVYGFQYMWQHNQASVNSAKWSIGYNVRVKVGWNTLWDADLAAAKALENQAYLASLVMPQNLAPIGRDNYKMLPQVKAEKKEQEDDDLLSYEMTDLDVKPPPNSPAKAKAAPVNQQQPMGLQAPLLKRR